MEPILWENDLKLTLRGMAGVTGSVRTTSARPKSLSHCFSADSRAGPDQLRALQSSSATARAVNLVTFAA